MARNRGVNYKCVCGTAFPVGSSHSHPHPHAQHLPLESKEVNKELLGQGPGTEKPDKRSPGLRAVFLLRALKILEWAAQETESPLDWVVGSWRQGFGSRSL